MGRSPCCDKPGIKKGPWTPEEDLILVSYIQGHGPGNWRSVPVSTGLLRCSKSCRLRWTNYLRPGIKRGSFTPHEEGIIIHLQAMLGNKWAAIASYLPQRTDNDIKNYWNTHLKKKLKKTQEAMGSGGGAMEEGASTTFTACSAMEAASVNTELGGFKPPALPRHPHSSSAYASSADNISRLLEGWMRSSEKLCSSCDGRTPQASTIDTKSNSRDSFMYHEKLCSFKLPGSVAWPENPVFDGDASMMAAEVQNPYLAFLEKWLLDDASLMELPYELWPSYELFNM